MKRENRREAPVAAFPHHSVRHARHLAPQVTHVEIDAAVARGRLLHARALRNAARLLVLEPIVAAVHLIGRAAGTMAERLRIARRRRQTLDALYALDTRMLRDIGIERDQIHMIAASLAASEPTPAATAATPGEIAEPIQVRLDTARAA